MGCNPRKPLDTDVESTSETFCFTTANILLESLLRALPNIFDP